MKILKGIISTLLAMIVIPIIMVFIVYLSTRSIVSKKGIDELFNKVNISSFLVDENGEYNSLGRDIKNQLVENGLPEEVIDEFVDSEQISEFFSDYVGEIVEFVVYDEDLDNLKASDISKLINDNVDDIVDDLREKKVEGYEELTDERVAQFKSEIDNVSVEIEKALPDIKKKVDESDAGTAIRIIRIIFSKLMLMIFIITIAVFFLLIALLNLKKFKYLSWIGAICIIAGFPFIFVTIIPSIIKINAPEAIIDSIKYALSKTALYGYIFMGIGLFLIVLGIIIRLVSKKNKEAKIDTPVAPMEPVATPVTEEPAYEETIENPIADDGTSVVEDTPVTSEPTIEEASEDKKEIAEIDPNEKESFCQNCGVKMNAGQKFCYNCGTSKE